MNKEEIEKSILVALAGKRQLDDSGLRSNVPAKATTPEFDNALFGLMEYGRIRRVEGISPSRYARTVAGEHYLNNLIHG